VDNYIETSVLLLALSDSEEADEAKDLLFGMRNSSSVSDLVLSEIYNLPEPAKDRSTRLVCELGLPSMRLSPSCVALARKYVYNKVVEGYQLDCGLHVAVAAVRGFKRMITSDSFIASELLLKTGPINDREGYGDLEVMLASLGCNDEIGRWLDGLRKVRDISYRATSRMDPQEILKGIETSALHLMREKSVKIERIGSIEIF
jgi:hypothetical protein